ncbi:MAG: DUF3108 domain-containing protein [Pseudolabrys sp.]
MLASHRYCRLVPVSAAALVAALAATPVAVRAQGKLDAQYAVTIAGITIGKGSWVVDITDTHYTSAANGATAGLVRVFSHGHGVSVAHGTLHAGAPQSSTYVSTVVSSKKTDDVRLTLDKGDVTDSRLDPPQEDDPDRVPITEQHQHGILDPMTAALLRTPGNGNPLSPEACKHSLPVFDGRLRYDLQLVFKRMDQVKAAKGYAGPVVVCAVYFTPVAGFIPSRSAIRYITKQRDIEVWLAPIAGTRVLVPFRAQGPSPIGKVVLEATQFVSERVTTRASVNGMKMQ